MNRTPIQIYPSILSGNFGCLAEEAKRIEKAGADAIHIDIMDGHFVPNLTLGPRAVAAINKATPLFLDIHMMIYNPYDYVEAFVSAGADRVTFHFEATEDVEDTIDFIRRCGKQAGLAFRPETSSEMVLKFIGKCDLILLMTVSPGFGGQKFMPEVLEKIQLTREISDKMKIKQNIQVDGGINHETSRQCAQAGANIFVSGEYLFGQPDLKQAIEGLRKNL